MTDLPRFTGGEQSSGSAAAHRVATNLARVRERIEIAAVAAGRNPSEVTLIGVAKYVDAENAAHLLRAGCFALGESRPQELWKKAADPRLVSAEWHLIGHLQSNKVRRTIPLITLMHSVDSLSLLASLQNESAALPHPLRALLEVNCSGETQKHGLCPDDVRALIERLDDFPNVQVHGLMTMAGQSGGPRQAQRDFAALRELRDRLRPFCPARANLDQLSMGMSGDFEAAIAEGATMVRVGSLLWEGVGQD